MLLRFASMFCSPYVNFYVGKTSSKMAVLPIFIINDQHLLGFFMIWLKRSAIVLLSIIALFVLLIILATTLVDPNKFKGRLITAAQQQADITLRLDGDIGWSFFPWVGLELADIGVTFTGENDILEFSKAEFGLEMLPLFSKTIKVDRLKLIDLKATLTVDEQGQANWQTDTPQSSIPNDLPATSAESTTTAQTTPSESDANSALELPDIYLNELIIENAQINYQDATTDIDIRTTINLTLYDVQWGQSWPLDMKVALQMNSLSSPNDVTELDMDLAGNFLVTPEEQKLVLSELAINQQLKAASLPVSPLSSALSVSQLDVDLIAETASLQQLAISTLGVEINANANASKLLTQPEFAADLSLPEFVPTEVLKQLSIELPAPADDTVMQSMHGSFKVSGNTQSVSLSDFQLAFDDSSLTATADVNLAPLSWQVDIYGKQLNVDRYLPESSEESTSDEKSVAGSNDSSANSIPAEESELIPVDVIRSLNGQINFSWEELKVANLTIDTVKLSSTQENGLVSIAPFSASLYEGVTELNATLDARGDTPAITITPNIQDVQLKPLVFDLAEKEIVTGVADLKGEIKTQGNQIDTLMNKSNGSLLVQVLDGAIIGTNLTKSVCEGIAKYRNEALTADAWTEDTPFDSLNFPANIKNGVVSTPGLKIQTAAISVTGDGSVSLPTSSFDYTTHIALVGNDTDNACRIKEDFKTLTFPVACSGKFSDDPVSFCRPDLDAFGKQLVKLAEAKLKEKAEEEKARAEAKLKEKAEAEAERLKNKLKSFF